MLCKFYSFLTHPGPGVIHGDWWGWHLGCRHHNSLLNKSSVDVPDQITEFVERRGDVDAGVLEGGVLGGGGLGRGPGTGAGMAKLKLIQKILV